MSKSKKIVNLTEGVIWKQLILFGLPLLASSVIQQLYNVVDLIFVGKLLGTESSAAIGASSLLVTCLVGFFTGMSVGSSVIVARFFGSGEKKRLSDAIHTSVWISFVGGLVLTVVGIVIAPWCLRAMQTPESILPMAITYIRIYFLGIIGVVFYNIGSGVLRAVGNTQFPMICQIVGGGIHVILDAFFLFVIKNGVVGVAMSTAISQVISAVMILWYMMKQTDETKLVLSKLKLDVGLFVEIFKIGVPAGIQAMVITFSNIFVQAQINGFDVDAIAAFTAYFRVELVLYLPIIALGQGVTTFAGQNIGAKQYDRVKQGVRQSLILGIGMTAVLSAFMWIFIKPAFWIFCKEAVVVELGAMVARITFPFYFIYVILEVFADTIRGAGVSLPPMIIILVCSCALRVVYLAIAMGISHTLPVLAAVYPISWAAAAAGMALYYFFGKWKKGWK